MGDLEKWSKETSEYISQSETSLCLTQEYMKIEHLNDISKLTGLIELSIYDSMNLHGKLDFLQHLTKLEKLELAFCSITDDDLIKIKPLINLTHLNLIQDSLIGVGFAGLSIPTLNELTMIRNSVNYQGVIEICNAFPNLKKFSYIDNSGNFDMNCLSLVCTSLKQLTELCLCDVNVFDYMILEKCPSLKHITVSYTEQPSNYIISGNTPKYNEKYSQSTMFPILPNVESLCLYREISDLIMPFIHLYTSLKNLSVRSLKHNLVGSNITKLSNLTNLSVHCYLQNLDLKFLLDMPQLEELDLRYNGDLNSEMLQYTTKLSNLKEFNLVGTKITINEIDNYRQYYTPMCNVYLTYYSN